MKKFLLSASTLIAILTLTSCSNDENSSSNNLRLVAKATVINPGNRNANNVNITEFQVNLKEIEFEKDDNYFDDDDSYGDGFYDDDDDISLRGPFLLNLLSGTTTITNLNLPNGVYKEVEFKMAKNTSSGSPLFTKSISIKGTINGTPFEFWHNEDEDFEIDYDDTNQNITVTDNTTTVTIDFDLSTVLAQVDLTQATDNDGDGLIEINPSDNDGNRNLADLLLDKIEEATDLDD